MPNIKSAKKRMKTSAERQDRNKTVKTRVASTRRNVLETIASGDKDAATESFRTYCSVLDRAVKKGVVKANTVNRRKSRVSHRLAAMG